MGKSIKISSKKDIKNNASANEYLRIDGEHTSLPIIMVNGPFGYELI